MDSRSTGIFTALLVWVGFGLHISQADQPKPIATGDQSLVVTKIPEAIRKDFLLSPFYQQCVVIEGMPIVASANVNEEAISEAAFTIRSMLRKRSDILRRLAANRVRLTVMSTTERTCDVPEHSDLEPKAHWNRRARGLGATPERPCVSCAEENVLNLNGDPYDAECILIHEFAHAVHQMALREIQQDFQAELERCYNGAKRNGLWRGTYAATNVNEYWAEGVQSWFDCNRENDTQHNHVNTREELQEFDPDLFALIKSVFVDESFRYVRSDSPDRKERHLRDLNRDSLPTFQWDAHSR